MYAAGLHSSGRTEEALTLLETSLAASPGNRQLLQAAAAMARDAGQEARALGYLEQLNEAGGL